MEMSDVLVIGGGPAGLNASLLGSKESIICDACID